MLSAFARDEWIQNRRRNRSFAVIWGLLSTGVLVTLAVFLVLAIRNRQVLGAFVILGALGPLVLYAGWYARGSVRAGLMITDETVAIRNPFRTREVAIADVVRFTAGGQPGQYGNPTPGVLLEVRAGRSYPVWTLAREGLVWNSAANVASWDGIAESLNNLLPS